MNVAQQEDERERELRRLTKAIAKILPNEMTFQQRAFLDNVIVLNLNGEA